MTFGWFDLAWPWIGLGFAVVLVGLLATSRLRTNTTLPRLRDLRWLSFLAVAVYLVHQVEEYGFAADGILHAFPDALCVTLGQPPYPGCAVPPLFFLAVNITLVWIAAPVAALLARRFPLMGLTLWGVIAVNTIVHIAPAILTLSYDPGLLTAVVLFLPLSVLTARAAFGHRGPYRASAGVLVVVAGALMHAVLAGGVLLFLRDAIPAWLLIAAQPVGIAIGYLMVGLSDRGLRRR